MTEAGPDLARAAESRARWRTLAKRLGVDIRPGEGAGALLLFLAFVFLFSFQYTTKSIRQATFVDSVGSHNLPWVYLLVALSSYPILRLYSRLTDRFSHHGLVIGTCLLVAGSMVGFWWLMRVPAVWKATLLYVWLAIVFGLTVSQFWYIASRVFDPRQARRLFGFIGAGGLLGSVGGGQVARLAARAGGTRAAMLVAVAMMLGAALVLHALRRYERGEDSEERPRAARLSESRGGFEILRKSRHLQLISLIIVLGVIVSQIVDLQFNWAIELATSGLDERTAYFGNLYSIIGLSAFAFQLLLTARIHQTLGVAAALRILPLSMILGAGGLLTSVFFALPVLTVALAVKVAENGFRYSVDLASRELLFLPVPSSTRVKIKAFISVFVDRSAKGVAALLLLPVTFGLFTPVHAAWISIGISFLWLLATRAVHREYVLSFRSGLKDRRVDSTLPIKISDTTTLELLIQSLGSPDPRQVLNSLEVLSVHGRGNLVLPLLLHHDDAQVRRRTLEILAEVGRVDAVPLIERRLRDPDPEIRAQAVHVLAQLSGRDACELMLTRLDEGDPGVRAAAVACLINHGSERYMRRAAPVLQELLADADPGVRAEAAKALSTIRDPIFQEQLIRLLYDSDPRVARQAIHAVRHRVEGTSKNPLYLPTLVSLLRDRRLKHDARRAVVAFGEPAIPALVHFMGTSDENMWVKRALPKAIAAIDCDASVAGLLECLASTEDAFLRRKVIEALGSIQFKVSGPRLAQILDENRREVERYLETLRDLRSLGDETRYTLDGPRLTWIDPALDPSLLEQLLIEGLRDHLRNAFGLLALCQEPEHIWPAHRALLGRKQSVRIHALEFLDNTLPAQARKDLFLVIDEQPLDEKLRRAESEFGIVARDKARTLKALLERGAAGDDRRASLAAAAIYNVYTDRIESLYGAVERLGESALDAFVRETAVWAMARLRSAAAAS